MKWRFDQFAVHCAVGLGLPLFVAAVNQLTGPGGHQCATLVLYPVGSGLASWWLPDGAPGASLVTAAFFAVTFPSDAGPTAQSLRMAFGIAIALLMLVAELATAAVRSRRQPP